MQATPPSASESSDSAPDAPATPRVPQYIVYLFLLKGYEGCLYLIDNVQGVQRFAESEEHAGRFEFITAEQHRDALYLSGIVRTVGTRQVKT